MANGEIADELRRMLEGNVVNGDDATRLLLVMVRQIQIDVQNMAESDRALSERVRALEDYNKHTPSVTYMWLNNRRTVVMWAVILALLYTFVFSPWLISDIRHAVLDMLHLPTDLGIGGVP